MEADGSFLGSPVDMLAGNGGVRSNSCRIKKPLIMTGLYKIIYQTSKRLGITHWYMITENKIYTILRKFGFVFHQVGKPINYHGLRAPCFGIVMEIERELADKNPRMLMTMLDGLEERYWPEIGWLEELKKGDRRENGHKRLLPQFVNNLLVPARKWPAHVAVS